jgi:hypothetical protein
MDRKPLFKITGRWMALVVVTLCPLCAPIEAHALNWYPILQGTPFEQFEEDDLQFFIAASRKTLNEAPDNQTVRWENPDTGRHGEITAVQSFEWQGRPCRQVRVVNEGDGRKASNLLYACKVESKWKLVSPSQLGK